MAVQYVTNALGGTTTTTSFSITLPTTQSGDIMILEYTHRGTGDATLGGTSISTDGLTWNEKHDQQYASSAFSGKTVWTRATGNHSGKTITGSGLTDSCAAIVTVYRGCVTSGDPLADATFVGEQNASGNETQAAITTNTDGAYVVLVVANSPDVAVTSVTATSPSSLTNRAERLSTGGTDTAIVHASAEKASAGSTGSFNWAQTNGASGSWAYSIRPAEAEFSQSAYRYYADGTESGSSAIDAQNTDIISDVSGGDVNVLLRIRLQETAGGVSASTDDYQLQYEVNDSGTWVDVTATGVLADTYDVANQDSGQTLNSGSVKQTGQSFIGDGNYVLSAKLDVLRSGTPTGNATAYLYASTGSHGSNAVPTGAPLATSNNIDVSTVGTSHAFVDFTFPTPYQTTEGTTYIIAVGYDSTGNFVFAGYDNVGSSDDGNRSTLTGSSWSSASGDLVFAVYTGSYQVIGYDSSDLTDGNATTERLT